MRISDWSSDVCSSDLDASGRPAHPRHMSSPALSPMKRPWIVIACAAFIVTLAMGVRQSFGLFLPQMSVDIGISRSDFGLAMALQHLLFGLMHPFVGVLAAKHGPGAAGLRGARHIAPRAA